VVDKNIVWDRKEFHRYIRKHQIHFLHFVPNELVELLGSEKLDNLDFVICGGERLEESIKDRIIGCGYKLYNHYGPTEITVDASVSTCGKGQVTIGTPIANVRCYIVNHYNMLMPIGAPGELCIAGAGLARGYLNKPELTAEKFVELVTDALIHGDRCRCINKKFLRGGMRKVQSTGRKANTRFMLCAKRHAPCISPPGRRGQKVYKTGDLARWLPDGNIEFLGRLDDQVKISGFRIEPGEIENTLKTHSAIKDAKILAKEYNPGDRRLVAYIILNRGKELGWRDLRGFLEKKLPHFMIPSAFVKLVQFPLTPNNKLDFRTLLDLGISNPGLKSTFVLPRTPIEKAIAEIWRDVLKISSLGVINVYHSFFELGGNSLLAVQVILRLQRVLGVELPVIALFETKTIANLAVRVLSTLQRNRCSMDLKIKPVSREEKLPLSFSQERLWFLDRYQPGLAVYNIPVGVRLLGLLDELALRYSLNQISQRHEVLRTTFHQEQGEPFQVITPGKAINVELPIIDLSHLPGIQQEEELYKLVYREVNRSFDLSNLLLGRAILLRKAKDHHLLLVTIHHIVFDGWSVDIFLEELGLFYEFFSRGPNYSPPLADISIQYADFTVWQRNWFQENKETLNRQLNYWKEQLKDVPSFLSFPTDKPRPHVQTFNGANFYFLVPQNLFGALKELSNSEGVTLFMALVAVFKLLLFRYSGISDTVVGTPIANRNLPGLENLIGFFVNTLVLRTSIDGNPGFKELLKRVRNVCLEAYRNQDYPFEHLVGKMHPERNLSYSPLFQVMFAFQVSMPETYKFTGITLVRDEIHTTTTKFDFTMFIEETPDELRGRIAYNTDLFYSETIQRISQHFLVLLNSAVKDPVHPISTLPILTETERRLLFYEWSNTQRDYPINRCIHHLIEDRVTRWPDAAVIAWRDQVLTYHELNHRGNRVADDLRSKGVQTGDIVGILLERSLEMVIGFLGVLKSGGAYLPFDINYPGDRIKYMLADSASKILLTKRDYSNEIKFKNEKIYISDVINSDPTSHHLHPSPLGIAPATSLAYVMYTSGSAGTPKGVLVSHGAVVRLLFGLDDVYLDGRPMMLQMAPFSFDASIFELWGPLVHGGLCVLYPGYDITITELAKVLRDHYIQVLWLTSALYNTIMDETPGILTGIQQLLIGGEALSVSHVRLGLKHLPHTQIINGYGPTEGTTFTCCYLIPPGLPAKISSIPIGRPIYNTRVYILDKSKRPVPIGVAGELFIAGDGLARGYLNNPELTAESFNQKFLRGTMRKAQSE
jgi:amino acid adenylation domain-containing protein